MELGQVTEIVKAFGPVGGFVIFIVIVVFKNGWLKVVLRDESASRGVDELTKVKADITALQTQVAILMDRWSRK